MTVPDYLVAPKPRDVEAFGQAFSLGQTPAVPTRAPTVRPGLTASQLSRAIYILLPLGIAVVIALFVVGGQSGSPLVGPAIILASAVVVFPMFLLPRRLLGTALEEARYGYTTVGGTLWASPKGSLDAYWVGNRKRVEFDFAGLWHVGSDGEVRAHPNRTLDPPGFYPSPVGDGQYELWTGRYWTRNFAESWSIETTAVAFGPDTEAPRTQGAEAPPPRYEAAAPRDVEGLVRVVFGVAGGLVLVPTILVVATSGVGGTPVKLGVAILLLLIGSSLLAIAARSRPNT